MRQFVLTARMASAAAPDVAPAAPRWLPAAFNGIVAGGLTSTNDVRVSTISRVPYPVSLASSHMQPTRPLPGCAAMTTLISHDGRCCISIITDTPAIADPRGLADDLRAGLGEVMALRG